MFNIDYLRNEGFEGFYSIKKLKLNCNRVPKVKGVYVVCRHQNYKSKYLRQSCGGWYKSDPTVEVTKLKSKWIENTDVLYIGRAGGTKEKTTLHSRIKAYMQFGSGLPISHWGGRYIWQLRGHNNFLVAVKVLHKEEPAKLETKMLEDFISIYGKLPFANLRR
ncbi:hypothetical protein [Dethiobacter alkaliphilus]|uniref:hypothetical protein n=1 Tax=Dethiobacter alkaliphilus TaxID=427926 RepID=UPI0022268B07|nr:hypothetical protein [Dethiobacter alkaliphilus]MCW3491534.1 hypothetical protein [Dethiobacter alkaliphilus]